MADSQRFERALILGATGMIGAHAVRAALRRGIAVRALVRPASDRRNLEGLRVEIAPGDLLDPASLAAALQDCDLLVHAAAPYPQRHFGKAALLARARTGLDHVLRAASEARLRRAVYVSSVTTIGVPEDAAGHPAPGARPARESDDRFPVTDSAPYFALKAMMERMVLDAARSGLPAVVVNPTFCIDELDARRTTAQLMIPLAQGQVPAYLPGRVNAVPTRDVGEGILLAAERGRIGERYILGGENLTSRELLARCAHHAGVRAPRFGLPLALAETVSLLTEVWAQLTRTRPLFPMTGIRMARRGQAYEILKARTELGYEPTDLDDAIVRAYAWYRQQGWLGPAQRGASS